MRSQGWGPNVTEMASLIKEREIKDTSTWKKRKKGWARKQEKGGGLQATVKGLRRNQP